MTGRPKCPLFITKRARNGGCCIDLSGNLKCARCHSMLGLETELLTELASRTVVVFREPVRG